MREIHQSLVDSPHKAPVMQHFDNFLWCYPKQSIEQIIELQGIWHPYAYMFSLQLGHDVNNSYCNTIHYALNVS